MCYNRRALCKIKARMKGAFRKFCIARCRVFANGPKNYDNKGEYDEQSR